MCLYGRKGDVCCSECCCRCLSILKYLSLSPSSLCSVYHGLLCIVLSTSFPLSLLSLPPSPFPFLPLIYIKVLQKLFESEHRYCNDLYTLVEFYYKQLKTAIISGYVNIQWEQLDAIFLNWSVAHSPCASKHEEWSSGLIEYRHLSRSCTCMLIHICTASRAHTHMHLH